MALPSIFDLEPSKISRDLKGKFILIYGQPKTGKSTFGSQLPRALFMNFEQGTNALAGIRSMPIMKWTDAKKVLSELRQPKAREMYDSIVVDTASIAWQLCEKYICQREGVDSIRDIPWGGGWTMLKNEFQEFWREITLLGFGILFIAHSKDKPTEMRDEDGEAITAVCPDLPNQCYTIINSIVDIIGYLQVQMNPDGTSERFLYTRSTPYVFAGSRYQYLAPKIKFGYQELVDAIGDAIDMAVEKDGAEVTDHTEIAQVRARPFNETMEEAKAIWQAYIGKAIDTDDKDQRLRQMKDIVRSVFGNEDFKLSTAVISQQDLVELFISEMKQLM
jgi:hypothetical protein